MRRSPVLAALMAGSALWLANGAAAQDACDLLQSRSSTVQLTRDGFFNFISEPVFGCGGDVIIRADSAVLDDVSGYTRFVGNFEYRDSTAIMTADRADHFASEGRLIGVGNVHITDGATGAIFEGDSTVLVGSSARREDGEMTIMGLGGRRAHAVILVSPQAPAPDSAEVPSDSPEVESDSALAGDSTGAAAGAAAENPEDPTTPGDSTQVATDTPAAPVDSAAAEVGEPEVATPDPPPPDTTPVPYDIDAERIHLTGADYMLATGNAELYNDEFRALADSIEYREPAGKLFLRGTAPRVFGYGAEYELSGDAVDLDMDGNQVAARGDAALSGSEIDLTAPEIRVLMIDGVLDRIVAMNEQPPEPELPGPADDFDTPSEDSTAAIVAAAGETPADSTAEAAREAPTDETTADAGTAPPEQAAGDARTEPAELVPGEAIPLGEEPAPGEAGALGTTPGETGDSAAAPPPSRPRAVAETFELEGDSIDVLAPNELLERVVAVGSARGESLARDSLNTEDTPEIARSDWVSGDTIIAMFRPVAADTSAEAGAAPDESRPAGGYQLDRLVALGEAASLYRMTPSGGDGAEGEEEPGEGEGEGEGQAEGEGEGEGEDIALEAAADPAQQSPEDEVPAENVVDEATAAEEVVEEEVSGEPAQEAAPGDDPDAQEAAPEEDPDAQEAAPEDDPDAQEPAEEDGGEEAASEAEPDNRLALHYVRGDLITIFMENGEVTSVIVEGNARGVQLEPLVASPPDTTTAPPDTTAAPPAARR